MAAPDKYQSLIEKGKRLGAPVGNALQATLAPVAGAPLQLSEELSRLLAKGELSDLARQSLVASIDQDPWKTFADYLQEAQGSDFEDKENALLQLQRRMIPLLTQIIQNEKSFSYLAKKNNWIDLPNYFKHVFFSLKKKPSDAGTRKLLRSLYDHFQQKKTIQTYIQKTEHLCFNWRKQFTDTVFIGALNALLGNLSQFNDKYLSVDLEFFRNVEESAAAILMRPPVEIVRTEDHVEARNPQALEELRKHFPKLLVKLQRRRQEQSASSGL